MAALATSISLEEKDGVLVDAPCAVDILYRGALIKQNAAGFAAPAAAEVGAVFLGVAEEEVDNSGGAAGDKNCKVKTEGIYLLTGAGLAQSDVGSKVYASDDQTISTVQGVNEQEIGRIERFVSATQVWVKLGPSL